MEKQSIIFNLEGSGCRRRRREPVKISWRKQRLNRGLNAGEAD